MRNKKQKTKNKEFGFTLIELIVAIAIFIIVTSLVISLLMTSLKGQKRVIAIQNVQDNARYLLEFMAKEIRMSEIDSSTYYTLTLKRADGETVSYSFAGGNITRTDPSTSGPINSDQVVVSGRFYTAGIGTGDNQQPKVAIAMKIETQGKPEEESEINIQTTLSPRNLEL